jgi:hypothetical protein
VVVGVVVERKEEVEGKRGVFIGEQECEWP